MPTTGTLATTTNNLGAFGATTSAQLAGNLTNETGTGVAVFSNNPTLVAPLLGAAQATTINDLTITDPGTSATLSLADGSTFVTAGAFSTTFTTTGATTLTLPTTGTLATTANNLGAFGTTTSAQLLGNISDETGSGLAVFSNSPTLVAPLLGAAQATTINDLTITDPGTSATLSLADGSAFITAGGFSTTLTTTGATTLILPTTGTLTTTSNNLGVFAATTSAQLRGNISDETGTGIAVFATAPTLVTPILGQATSTSLQATNIALGNVLGTGSSNPVITGSNLGGTVTVDQDGSVTANNPIITVNLTVTFPAGAHVVLTPANAATAALAGAGVWTSATTTSFTINAGTTPPAANTYSWNYLVVGN